MLHHGCFCEPQVYLLLTPQTQPLHPIVESCYGRHGVQSFLGYCEGWVAYYDVIEWRLILCYTASQQGRGTRDYEKSNEWRFVDD